MQLNGLSLAGGEPRVSASANASVVSLQTQAKVVTPRIRVAYVVNAFHFGGLERCAARLINHLDRTRFDPLLICLNRLGDAVQWLDDPRVPLIELRKGRGNDPGVVWRLGATLRRHAVDLVHSHNWGTLVEAVLARRGAGIPFHVHLEHGLERSDLEAASFRKRLRGMAMRWALNRCDAVATVTDSLRLRINERCGFPAARVSVIPNGVELTLPMNTVEHTSKIRSSLGIDHDAFLVGSLGRLAPVKNFGLAIDAIRELAARGHNVHFLLIGTGPDEEALRAHAVAERVAERVHFVGQQAEIGVWLPALDVYVNSSISEGMSLSILEAMAAGRPCVVTDVGGNAALVGGTPPCGLVVPSGSTKCLADAIERLRNDAGLRSQLSQEARARHSARYSVASMVKAYEEFYARVCRKAYRRCTQHS